MSDSSSSFSPRFPPPWLLDPNFLTGVSVQAGRFSWFLSLLQGDKVKLHRKNIQEKLIYIIKRWHRLGVYWLALFKRNCAIYILAIYISVFPHLLLLMSHDAPFCPIFNPYHPIVSFTYSTSPTQVTCNTLAIFSLWQLQRSK